MRTARIEQESSLRAWRNRAENRGSRPNAKLRRNRRVVQYRCCRADCDEAHSSTAATTATVLEIRRGHSIGIRARAAGPAVSTFTRVSGSTGRARVHEPTWIARVAEVAVSTFTTAAAI